MDTMKYLLGATLALLLIVFGLSWKNMNEGVKNAPADERARLEKQLKELAAEQRNLAVEREAQTYRKPTAVPASSNAAAEIEAMRLQVETSKAAVAQLEMEKSKRDAKLNDSEELLMDQRKLETSDSELRRARMISEALLIGRIREYVEDGKLGGFITLDVLMQEQVQAGTILAIRRKTGILGQLKVSEVSTDGAIANPLPGFGPVKPQVGDELILPPQY
jgi:hypothetical protein